jgi:hypothetical protein
MENKFLSLNYLVLVYVIHNTGNTKDVFNFLYSSCLVPRDIKKKCKDTMSRGEYSNPKIERTSALKNGLHISSTLHCDPVE